jgi:cytochrome c-L
MTIVSMICIEGELFSLAAAPVAFSSVLDGTPLGVKPQVHEIETEAVKEFKATGRNPYNGEATAVATGQGLYETNCQVCHAPNGTGKISKPHR